MLGARLTDGAQGRDKANFRCGDERRQESRDTYLEHRLAKSTHGSDIEGRPVEIMPGIAIDLQVDETSAEPLLLAMLLEFDRRDHTAFGRHRDAPARRGIAAKDALGRGGGHGSAGKFRSGGRVDIQRAIGVLLDD